MCCVSETKYRGHTIWGVSLSVFKFVNCCFTCAKDYFAHMETSTFPMKICKKLGHDRCIRSLVREGTLSCQAYGSRFIRVHRLAVRATLLNSGLCGGSGNLQFWKILSYSLVFHILSSSIYPGVWYILKGFFKKMHFQYYGQYGSWYVQSCSDNDCTFNHTVPKTN